MDLTCSEQLQLSDSDSARLTFEQIRILDPFIMDGMVGSLITILAFLIVSKRIYFACAGFVCIFVAFTVCGRFNARVGSVSAANRCRTIRVPAGCRFACCSAGAARPGLDSLTMLMRSFLSDCGKFLRSLVYSSMLARPQYHVSTMSPNLSHFACV